MQSLLSQNSLGSGAFGFNPIGHTPISNIGMQPPAGGLANLEDGLLFLIDKDRPRTEEEIKERYRKAQEEAARQRREGFLGQVVLPGEMAYEDFKATNLYNFKRNPNLPDSAYKDFDMTDVSGFDNAPIQDENTLPALPKFDKTPGLPPQQEIVGVQDPLKTVGIGSLQPYQNQFKDFEKRLENIEQGVGSLLDKNQMYMSNNMGVQGYSSTGYSPNSVIGNLLRWSYR